MGFPSNRFGIAGACVVAGLTLTGAAFGQTCTPQAFPHSLAPPSLDANALYGASVAIGPTEAVVGAPDENVGKGSTFVHTLVNGEYTSGLEVTASDGLAGDHFGAAVALDGDLLFVGAPDDDDKGVDAGCVYVYHRALFFGFYIWVFDTKVYGTDTVAGDRFGAAVAAKGGYLIVGAPNDNIVYFHQGSAYAFEVISGAWTQTDKLLAGNSQVNENFGSSVAVDGIYAVVGGPGFDNLSPAKLNSGRAAIFKRDVFLTIVKWPKDSELNPLDPVQDRKFGSSCAIVGSRMIVGGPGAWNFNGQASGAAYVFELAGAPSAWSQKTKLIPLLGVPGDLIGSGVALGTDSAYLAAASRVFRFDYAAAVWSEKSELAAPFADLVNGAPQKLGPAIAAAAPYCIVGRPSASAGDTGHAFPFHLCGGTWTTLGSGTLGSGGIAKLRGAGALEDAFAFELRMKYGKASAPCVLLVHGGNASNLPFHGGILYAFPANITVSFPLDANGEIALPAVMPAGLANTKFVLQAAIADPISNGGIGLTNGLEIVTAP